MTIENLQGLTGYDGDEEVVVCLHENGEVRRIPIEDFNYNFDTNTMDIHVGDEYLG